MLIMKKKEKQYYFHENGGNSNNGDYTFPKASFDDWLAMMIISFPVGIQMDSVQFRS
jgi:hypothetical protein